MLGVLCRLRKQSHGAPLNRLSILSGLGTEQLSRDGHVSDPVL